LTEFTRRAGPSGADRDPADRDRDSPDRDRDRAGRARNARPRDGLGRPLERGAAGEPAVPDDEALPPGEALAAAQRLLDAGRPFHAHEVLEAAWKAAPGGERDLWQGLAQLAVGVTHALRGNAAGAVTLLRRGTHRISPYEAAAPHGIDVAGLAATATGLADRISRDPRAELTPDQVRLRLRAAA